MLSFEEEEEGGACAFLFPSSAAASRPLSFYIERLDLHAERV